jgi:hypothetical protein
MTKRERERVRRAAAVIAIAPLAPSLIDVVTNDDRDEALRRWRGYDEGEAEPKTAGHQPWWRRIDS